MAKKSVKHTERSLPYRLWRGFCAVLQFFMVFAVALVLLIELSQDKRNTGAELPEDARPELLQVASFMATGQHAEALQLSQQLIADKPELSSTEQCWLWHQQRTIYLLREHRHLAIATIDKCLAFALPEQDRQLLQQQRIQLAQWIDKNQVERSQYTSYANLRQSGYARQLLGDIVVVYVYLEDNLWQGWSSQQRFIARENFEQVGRWYQQQAKIYQQSQPAFDIHYFYVQTGRGVSAQWLRSADFFSEAAPLLLAQMGYSNWQQMHDYMTNFGKRQLAVIFHSNQESRSFARSCKKQDPACAIEYVMLTEQSLDSRRWLVSQVQAHEMAHLFGAADLYNIEAAKNYATTDLMNYFSSELQYAEISPVTAWALGWRHKPNPPFELEE